jgi:hypothetical protein
MRTPSIFAAGVLLAAAGLAEAQPYVSAQLGFAKADWPRGAPVNGRVDDRSLAYGVDFGVAFGRYWAVELGAYGYEDFDATGTPCTSGTVCPLIVTEFGGNNIRIVKAALAPRFEVGEVQLIATFGYYRATIDANLALPGARSHDRGAVLGLGARWYFADPWSVSLQAVRFDSNLQQLMVGVGWGLRRNRNDRSDRSE